MNVLRAPRGRAASAAHDERQQQITQVTNQARVFQGVHWERQMELQAWKQHTRGMQCVGGGRRSVASATPLSPQTRRIGGGLTTNTPHNHTIRLQQAATHDTDTRHPPQTSETTSHKNSFQQVTVTAVTVTAGRGQRTQAAGMRDKRQSYPRVPGRRIAGPHMQNNCRQTRLAHRLHECAPTTKPNPGGGVAEGEGAPHHRCWRARSPPTAAKRHRLHHQQPTLYTTPDHNPHITRPTTTHTPNSNHQQRSAAMTSK